MPNDLDTRSLLHDVSYRWSRGRSMQADYAVTSYGSESRPNPMPLLQTSLPLPPWLFRALGGSGGMGSEE